MSSSPIPSRETHARKERWPLVGLVGAWPAWLVAATVAGVLHLLGPGLIAHLAASDEDGFEVEFFDNIERVRPAALTAQLPTLRLVPLPLARTAAAAHGVWKVETPGTYTISLTCDDWGRVHVDGALVLEQERAAAGKTTGTSEVDVDAGWHVVEVHGHNVLRQGSLSLEISRRGDDAPVERIVRPRGPAAWLASTGARLAHGCLRLAIALAVATLVLFGARRVLTPAGTAALGTLLIAVVPLACLPPRSTKEPFANPELVSGLAREKPAWVFIGNSQVPCRIDTKRLRELTGAGAHVVRLPGTRTAAWYLAMKNYVAASGIEPKATFLFFRDHWLTLPRLKTSGQQYVFESLSPGDAFDEPRFDELVTGGGTFRRKLEGALRDLVPASGYHRRYYTGPSSLASDGTARYIVATDDVQARRPRGMVARDLDTAVNERFRLDRLKGDVDLGVDPDVLGVEAEDARMIEADAAFDFEARVEQSFLPDYVQLSKEHSLGLVLVRIKRRPGPDGRTRQDPRLAPYLSALDAWLEKRGIPWFDLTGEETLTLDWYGRGDHIATTHTTRYTELLHERLREVFTR